MIARLWIGTVLAAMPAVLALSWAVQRRVAARYVACLLAGLACGAGFAALFAVLGARATYDPAAGGPLGNWSGLVGAVIGMGAGWITGTVTGPALLLRLLGVRLAAGRVILAILVGVTVSGLLIYALEAFRAGAHPLAYSMRVVAGLSSASTFVGFVLAAREQPDP